MSGRRSALRVQTAFYIKKNTSSGYTPEDELAKNGKPQTKNQKGEGAAIFMRGRRNHRFVGDRGGVVVRCEGGRSGEI